MIAPSRFLRLVLLSGHRAPFAFSESLRGKSNWKYPQRMSRSSDHPQ
jgi:hypothetical protein